MMLFNLMVGDWFRFLVYLYSLLMLKFTSSKVYC